MPLATALTMSPCHSHAREAPDDDVTVLIELSPFEGAGARVYTFGMADHGYAELFIEDVRPQALASHAAEIVKRIAHYMFSGEAPVRPGETFVLDPTTIVRLEIGGIDDHGTDMWEIVDETSVVCPACEGGDHVLYARDPPRWLN